MASKKSNIEKETFVCRSTLSQIAAVIVKNIVLIGYGMSLGFPTLLIPDLSQRTVDDALHLGPEGLSWIGSINLITVPLGCLMSGVVTQPLGRRRSMQILNIPFAISWVIYYFSSEVWHILLTLAITGLAGGLMEAPIITYVAEISEPHLRGMLSTTASVAVAAGTMIQLNLGTFLEWKSAALCSLIISVLSVSLLFFIPETPTWLLSKGKYEEAKQSLAWLRGWVPVEDVTEEYEELLCSLRLKNKSKEHDNPNKVDRRDKLVKQTSVAKSLRKRNFIRPCILATFTCFLVHFCGLTPIQIYAVNIFESLRSPIEPHSATALLGVVGLIGSIICVLIIRKCGRRKTAFISLSGTTIAFFALGTYAHVSNITSLLPPNNVSKLIINETLQSSMELSGSTSWFPFIALILGIFTAQMGIRLLPWTLIGEIFPNDIRALAAGIVGMNFYVIGFVCSKTFIKFTSLVSAAGTFWFFSAISAVGIAVLYYVLPETEGKTLHEIVRHFSGESKLGNNINRKRNNAEKENEQSEKLCRNEYDIAKHKI